MKSLKQVYRGNFVLKNKKDECKLFENLKGSN